jgi:hypothetical protein
MYHHRFFASTGVMLHPLSSTQREPALRDLRENGCRLYELDAAAFSNEYALFRSLMSVFVPEEQFPPFPNWQGMYDYLWHAFFYSGSREAAVVIDHCNELSSRDLTLFLNVLEFFLNLAHIISGSQWRPDSPKPSIRVILVGTGSGYPVY